MKLFTTILNWSFSPITFSISLFIVLRKTIGLNDLEKLYNFLLSLDIITMVDFLKYKD